MKIGELGGKFTTRARKKTAGPKDRRLLTLVASQGFEPRTNGL
jgi:hypothetical protein